jgi:hypothetical protein
MPNPPHPQPPPRHPHLASAVPGSTTVAAAAASTVATASLRNVARMLCCSSLSGFNETIADRWQGGPGRSCLGSAKVAPGRPSGMEECRGHVGPHAHNPTASIKSIEKNQMTHDAVWLEPPRNLSPLLGSADHRSSHAGRDRLPRSDRCDQPMRERIDHTARTVGGSIILSAEDIPRRLPVSGYNCPVGQSRRLSTVAPVGGLLKSFVNLASFCQNPHARIFSYHRTSFKFGLVQPKRQEKL